MIRGGRTEPETSSSATAMRVRRQDVRRSHARLWRHVVALIALSCVSFVLAACTSASDASNSTGVTSSPGTSQGNGLPAATVAALNKLIAAYSKEPAFTASDGAPITLPKINVSKVRGKRVFYIPLDAAIPYEAAVLQGNKDAAKAVGITLIPFQSQGTVASWTDGMNLAISEKVNAIIIEDVVPALIAPQIAQARAVGIPVVEEGLLSYNAPLPSYKDVVAITPVPVNVGAELDAAYTILNSNGHAHALVADSPDQVADAGMKLTYQSMFKKYCPDCTLKYVSVPSSQWASTLQPAVQSALSSDPGINYLIPQFDSMATWAIPGMTAAGAADRVKIVTFNGTPLMLQYVQDSKNNVVMDVGSDFASLGYAGIDATARVLTGVISPEANGVQLNEAVGVRVFTVDNVDAAGTPPVLGNGYGSAITDGYLKLWGLSS
jgi:ribose transport system substrate-binding protein